MRASRQGRTIPAPAPVAPQSAPAAPRSAPAERELRGTTDAQLARTITKLLRHDWKLVRRADGYVKVAELIGVLATKKGVVTTIEQLRRIVINDPVKRYELREADGQSWMRATQAHSVPCVTLEALGTRLRPGEIPLCYHGTSRIAYDYMQKGRGLSCMGRRAAQMAGRRPDGSGAVIPGIRPNCECVVEVNVEAAMAEEIEFYVASNGVVMCHGVPPKFLTLVE